MLKVVVTQDSAKIISEVLEFGLIDPRESDEAKNNFVELLNVAIEPFLIENTKFIFASTDYNHRSKEIIRTFVSSLKYSPPPHKILFLHRKLGGIFALLRKLNLELDLTPYWKQITGGN